MKFLQKILALALLTYINAFTRINLSPIKTDIVILTGSRINKSKYISIVGKIEKNLYDKDILANIFVIDSFFKEVEIKALLKKKSLADKFHIVGHSFGSYEAGLYSENNNNILSLIQICGNFNLANQHPYPSLSIDSICAPTLTILGELDDKLPITDAILDKSLIKSNNKIIALENFKHLSIIDDNYEQKEILCNIIAEYIYYIETTNKDSLNNIVECENKTNKKFNKYIESFKHSTVTKSAKNAQNIVNNITNKNNTTDVCVENYSLELNIIDNISQNSSRYFNIFLPKFITSHPSNKNNLLQISVLSTLKNNILSFISTKKISNSEIWLKLCKTDEQISNPGMKIGENMLSNLVQNLSEEEKEQYIKKIVFAEDIVINSNIPMCSVLWLCTPISIRYIDTNIVVRVPVLQTPTDIPEYVKKIFGDSFGNSLNVKMLSESQMYEWILVKSRM